MNAWSGRRVLVTGATGLVGSRLCEMLLEQGADVVALVMDQDPQSNFYREGIAPRCSVVNGRLQDGESVARAISLHRTDSVFHLGAQTQVRAALDQPLETFESNVKGTWCVMEACRQQKSRVERVVVASTDKVYGDAPLPYLETGPLLAVHPYDASKLAAETVVRSYVQTFGVPAAVSRCGNIYGPGDLNWDRIVPGTIRCLLQGKSPYIRSNGLLVRDYIYVDDAVLGLLALGEQAHREDVRALPFNFSAEAPRTVLEMVAAISDAMGVHIPPTVANVAHHEIAAQHLSSARAHEVLGWHTSVTQAEALRRSVAWYRKFLGGAA